MIRLENFTKEYTRDKPILDYVNLVVSRGEWCMITGPSGTGKTTLLFVLGFLDPGNLGSYCLDDRLISQDGRFAIKDKELALLRMKKVGFLFQDSRLLPYLNVLDNVSFPHWLYYGNRAEAKKKAMFYLEAFGLEALKTRKVQGLSAGEKHRVALARALINEPEIILADEPTGNLDGLNSQRLMKHLQEIHDRGTTIIMVTHDKRLLSFGDKEFSLNKKV